MELQVNGREARVTGVIFEWSLRCPLCHEVVHVSRNDGGVRVGLEVSASRKTCRWYQREYPNAMPSPPVQCKGCGAKYPYRGSPSREARPVMVGAEVLRLLDRAWQSFRAEFPEEAAAADRAMLRTCQHGAGRVQRRGRCEDAPCCGCCD